MTKPKIQQLNIQNQLSSEEQQQILGGNNGESLLNEFSIGQSNLSKTDNISKFTNINGNVSGLVVHKDGSDFYIKDGIIEKMTNGELTDSLNLNSAFL